MGHTREATEADCYDLAPNLREADQKEIRAATGRAPLDILLHSLRISDPGYALVGDEGEVFALVGVAPTADPLAGVIWLLGSDGIRKHAKQFLRECPAAVEKLHERYPILFNLIDERNIVHIRWLEWMGFSFLRRIPHGVNGEIFIEFARISSNV